MPQWVATVHKGDDPKMSISNRRLKIGRDYPNPPPSRRARPAAATPPRSLGRRLELAQLPPLLHANSAAALSSPRRSAIVPGAWEARLRRRWSCRRGGAAAPGAAARGTVGLQRISGDGGGVVADLGVWRTEHKSLCNLLFADAVQGHTTENVCQDNEDEDIITRAWELPKRILIYCLDHEIDPDIDTPVRDHIKFPKVKKPVGFLKNRVNLLAEKKKRTYDESFLDQPSKEPAKVTGRVHVQERKQTIRKLSVNISSGDFVDEPEKKRTRFLKQKIRPEPQVAKDASLSSPKPVQEQEEPMVPLPSSDTRKIPPSSFPVVDSETEKRQTDRIIAQGKLERSVQAVEAALKKLENGGNVDDAKAVCEPDVLKQLARWHVCDY
ncbi:hypothetical protein PR202_gb16898 [Eleusine coracana subsp. coracana]|uniref:Uncharacterized protein n=1 Tax=Eleusine coracana subsp. coracana TaxID=191504 RepID=A0AAV5EZ92_ELECO|nr:hypothetical protein PR202_gb16898 [Eleusine coracana subsp. coracana]